MPHKLLPIDKLHIQDGYNTLIRTDKETANNAKEVAQFMETQGDNPELFPIRFVEIDKQLFTRNHATLAAAHIRGWKEVYAVKSPHEAGTTEDYLDLLMSNNAGHPVGRVAQGNLYKTLRDGEPETDKAILDAIPEGGDIPWKRAPMTEKEIGEACRPVYTEQHVKDCITLAESSPDIQELIESEQVSCNIVITAGQWAKGDEAKQYRILKAAVRQANADGKDKATKKHLDAIKSDFVKLKAANNGADDKGKDEPPADDNKPTTGKKDANKDDTKELPGDDAGGDSTATDEAEELFKQQTAEVLTEGSKKNKKLVEALKTFLTDDAALEKINVTMTLNPDEAEALAVEVIKIVTNAAEVF